MWKFIQHQHCSIAFWQREKPFVSQSARAGKWQSGKEKEQAENLENEKAASYTVSEFQWISSK